MGDAKVRVGLYGSNGHQLQRALVGHPSAEVVAVAGIPEEALPGEFRDVPRFPSLAALLENSAGDLISLCSPRRDAQARDAMLCLAAGKHVYAEKPSAMTERDLDALIAAAHGSGRRFHEQAATAVEQPYKTLRGIVRSGVLGEIVQVYAQKSYPWHGGRPQDEGVDGGLVRQAGIYCARFVEHVACVPIKSVTLQETTLGNPVPGGECRRASAMSFQLANGGLATGIANYLCPAPPHWGRWGYETLRIWGVNGFVESLDGGRVGTLAVTGQECSSLDFSVPGTDFLGLLLEEIQTGKTLLPFTLEDELSPTRWVIRAMEQREARN